MIKIEKTRVSGFEEAIRGMRNSHNSWNRRDSGYCGSQECDYCNKNPGDGVRCEHEDDFLIGPNDRRLMETLIAAGSSHCKFRRMITVWCDITAPLYWWKQMDQSKVGTVSLSTSTMNSIMSKPLTADDFSIHYAGIVPTFEQTIEKLNNAIKRYGEEDNKTIKDTLWECVIELLPESYNQLRTVMLNYEVLASIVKDRRGHKLMEWQDFITWAESLPESWIITGGENGN